MPVMGEHPHCNLRMTTRHSDKLVRNSYCLALVQAGARQHCCAAAQTSWLPQWPKPFRHMSLGTMASMQGPCLLHASIQNTNLLLSRHPLIPDIVLLASQTSSQPSSHRGPKRQLHAQVHLLNSEHNPDIMLLAARALTFLADVLPSSCSSIVRHGAVPAFCSRLLTIEYIDLAEQSLQVQLHATLPKGSSRRQRIHGSDHVVFLAMFRILSNL